MRFRFVEEHRSSIPANRLCEVVGVGSRGLRGFRSRPAKPWTMIRSGHLLAAIMIEEQVVRLNQTCAEMEIVMR
jgi:hypothetical protein